MRIYSVFKTFMEKMRIISFKNRCKHFKAFWHQDKLFIPFSQKLCEVFSYILLIRFVNLKKYKLETNLRHEEPYHFKNCELHLILMAIDNAKHKIILSRFLLDKKRRM